MSGVDLHRCLAERGIDMPVIVLAAGGDVPTAVRALEAGALDCMEEPIQAQALVHRVRDALNRYRS
jgi:two-component system response regulator FixJ